MARIFTPQVIATIIAAFVSGKVMHAYEWPWYEAVLGQAVLFVAAWYVIPGVYELARMSTWGRYATERLLLMTLLGIAFCCAVAAIFVGRLDRWLNTISILVALAVPLQAYVSGFFERLSREFANEKKYPGGPSGPYAREVIRSSETPILNWVETKLFMDPKTSIALIVLGAVLQFISIWIAP